MPLCNLNYLCKLAFVVACVLFGLKSFGGLSWVMNDFSFWCSLFENLTCKRGKKKRVVDWWCLFGAKEQCGVFLCGGSFVTRVWAFHTHHVITCGKFEMVY